MDFKEAAHRKILSRLPQAEKWFQDKARKLPLPFCASFDIRDSSYKAAPVDANVFPAGFNNICEIDRERCGRLIGAYMKKVWPQVKAPILLAEEHTSNLHYWDNIAILQEMLKGAGYPARIAVPGKTVLKPSVIESAAGRRIDVSPLPLCSGDLIISNNDFSSAIELPCGMPCDPPPFMGWRERRKYDFFLHYNRIAEEFAALIGLSPSRFTVQTQVFSPFDISNPKSLKALSKQAGAMLKQLSQEGSAKAGAAERSEGISEESGLSSIGSLGGCRPQSGGLDAPFLFLKSDTGTYGLAVTAVSHSSEIERWNYKTRKRMKSSKAGSSVSGLILQEGIPTRLEDQEGGTAEPVIYMAGAALAGGFLRSHKRKDKKSNLNSPGSVYQKLCVSDLEIEVQGMAMENVYGWLGRLGLLALGMEIQTAIKAKKSNPAPPSKLIRGCRLNKAEKAGP